MFTSRIVPGGNCGRRRSISSRTARATSSVFAFEICSTPTLMPGREDIETRNAAMDRNKVRSADLSLTGVYRIERLPIKDALPL